MFEHLKKRIKNEKGLSLVELLAVIVILGIIAAIAIPAIGNIVQNSRVKAEVADAIQVMNAANIYFTDNPEATSFTDENAGDYVESGGNLTDFTVSKPNATNKATSNTITFTGKNSGTHTGKTLDNLTKATVSDGNIVWPGTTTTPAE